ncbi:hypothetical protein [Nocardia sp. R6R-6]|uniref:hypothetical protein n=1 Tax=Nocardia sp. R6R-6 TaxID=3459303 RepID=UPI00403D7055
MLTGFNVDALMTPDNCSCGGRKRTEFQDDRAPAAASPGIGGHRANRHILEYDIGGDPAHGAIDIGSTPTAPFGRAYHGDMRTRDGDA